MVLTKAWLPLGSEKKAITKAEKDKIEQYKKYPGSWPKGLWSFELWCAATGYDETKADGGPQFQTLMSMLLVENGGERLKLIAKYEDGVIYNHPGTHAERYLNFEVAIDPGAQKALITKADKLSSDKAKNSDKQDPSYWFLTLFMEQKKGLPGVSKGSLTHGTVQKQGSRIKWLFTHRLEDQRDSTEYQKGLNDVLAAVKQKHRAIHHSDVTLKTNYVHSPATQGLVNSAEYPGITQGAIIGTTSNTQYKAQNTSFKGHLTSVARQTCSKLQWLQHTMSSIQAIQPDGGKAHSHSSEVSFKTDGHGNSSCNEGSGCMSTANLTAALFGLYYYDGCDLPERKWAVEQTIDGKKHVVRMRMYNPNYKAVESKLWVQAEINTEYKNEHKHKYVGQDKKGFPLPSIFQERKYDHVNLPIDPWLQIHDQAEVSRLAPFFETDEVKAKPTVIERCTLMHKLLNDVVHEPGKQHEQTLFFGFNIPSAHWLYPHFELKNDPAVKLFTGSVGKSIAWPKYQAWPKLTRKYKPPEPFNKMFEWDENLDPAAQRRRALQISTTPLPPTPASPQSEDESEDESQSEDESEDESEEEPEDVAKLTVIQLRERLKTLGMSTKGKKAELVKRLKDARARNKNDDPLEDLPPAQPTEDLPPDEEPPELRGETPQQHADTTNQGLAQNNASATTEDPVMTPGGEIDLGIADDGTFLETELDESVPAGAKEKETLWIKAADIVKPKRDKDGNSIIEALAAGSPRSGKDVNAHWSSVRTQPWPHEEIYKKSEIAYEMEPMDQGAASRRLQGEVRLNR